MDSKTVPYATEFVEVRGSRIRVVEAGACRGCDAQRAGDVHSPRHNASPRCESGSYPHCTCDACW